MVSIPMPPRHHVLHLEGVFNRASIIGLAFIAGFATCSAYDRVPDLWQKKAELQRVETAVVPKLKQQAAQVPALKAKVEEVKHERDAVVQQLNANTAPADRPRPFPEP